MNFLFSTQRLYIPIGTLLGLSLLGAPAAQADFIADSKGSLEARNFYFNRDFRQDGSRDKAEEWAQGFLLRMESGYTAGTLGFGLDALGMAGFKLDSGGGTAGTNLLPPDLSGGSQDRYGELGLTAKVRLSNSTLKLGTLQIKDPVVNANDTRLLPGTFKGALVNVQEVDRLKLTAGQLTQINFVDSTDYQDMTANRIGGKSDKFQFAGADYQFLPNLTAQYRYGKLENIYQQTTWVWCTCWIWVLASHSRAMCAMRAAPKMATFVRSITRLSVRYLPTASAVMR